MQHIHTPTLPFDGHNNMWRTVKYLAVAIAGLMAIFEHSPGLLIVLAIALVMGLALTERARKLENELPGKPQASAARVSGDGGSFPGAMPETEHQGSESPRVLDGGSL